MTKEFINSMYQKYLGRDPEEDGFKFWNEKLEKGEMTEAEVEAAIVASPESKARNQDPMENFILKFEFSVAQTNAILNVLGNSPFYQVANLVELIRSQGEPQFKAALEAEANKEA